MAIRAKIELSYISIPTELKLVQQRGFHVAWRQGNRVILQKGFIDKIAVNDPVLPWDQDDHTAYPYSVEPKNVYEIPDYRQKELERKCDRIHDCFINPHADRQAIRDQIAKMCSRDRLSDIETEFVENWVYSNVL